MLQSDLLDTLFLNRKALADVGGVGSGTAGKNTTESKATTTTTTTIKMKSETPPAGVSSGSETCPVDHKSREVWMAQARAAQQAQETGVTQSPRPPTQASQPTSTSSSWGWRIPFFGASSSSSTQTQQSLPQTSPHSPPSLPDSRVVSTIPRSSTPGATPNAATTNTACPVNHETETGADPKTGNWVYPSEKMFFEAMKRKGHDTRAADMKTVVPIHNAVNERAWAEIKRWEAPYGKSTCPNGPTLDSFTGLSTKMSPRARLNTLLGYTAPFDRHDWVVDRCGTKVEYVIDFYTGKGDGNGIKPMSFYLDVRPKLNSWEGVRMRAVRALGLI